MFRTGLFFWLAGLCYHMWLVSLQSIKIWENYEIYWLVWLYEIEFNLVDLFGRYFTISQLLLWPLVGCKQLLLLYSIRREPVGTGLKRYKFSGITWQLPVWISCYHFECYSFALSHKSRLRNIFLKILAMWTG